MLSAAGCDKLASAAAGFQRLNLGRLFEIETLELEPRQPYSKVKTCTRVRRTVD